MKKRSKIVKNLALFTLIVLLLLTAVACGGSDEKTSSGSSQSNQQTSTAPEKQTKDSITIAIPAEPTMLDPQKEDDGNMRLVTESVFEGLMALDGKTLQPIPALATDYKQVDDLHWEFTLRQGVKFHNGDTFNADDVVYSIERQIDPALNSNIIGFFQAIDTIEKIDDYQIRITTKGPSPTLLTSLTLLKILDKDFAESNQDQLVTKAVGTGPYKVADWRRGVSIKLEANDDYWGEKPFIKNVSYRFIEEDATRAAALQAGEVDLAVNMLPEYIDNLPKVETIEGLEFALLRPNSFKGIMSNPKIREAAALSVDKEALAQGLYEGYAKVAPGQVFKSGYFGFNPNLQAYPYDPEKAKQLLKEAGYKGEPIEMVAESGRWLKDRELWETAASMMQQVGLNVNVKMTSFQEWLDILFNRSKAPDMIVTFHSNDIFDADRTFSTFVHTAGPASSYTDALDKKIEALRSEMDLNARQKGYEEVGQTVYDTVGLIPLISIMDIYGMGKDISYTPREDMRLAVWDIQINQ